MRSLLIAAICVTSLSGQTVADRCREILNDALKDNNPDVRKEAVLSLSLGGARQPFLGMLTAMLDDKDVQVRLATIASLEDLGSKGALDALHTALNDETPEVSYAAAKALWAMKDPAGKAALLSVLSGETKTSSSFLTLQKRDALRLIHTPKPMFLFALKAGAGFVPIPGVGAGVASMQGILSDPGVSGRATAALLLGTEKDKATAAALRDALEDKDWSVRAAAVHSLALRNDVSVKPDLARLLNDSKEQVRLRAAAGYLRLAFLTRRRPAK